MDNKLTVREIVDETIEYYRTHRRAEVVYEGVRECVYLAPDGAMCAVGRCLLEDLPQREHLRGGVGMVSRNVKLGFTPCPDASMSSDDGLDAILKPQYRGHPLEFWQNLQRLHDDAYNWTSYGGGELSANGVALMLRIRVAYTLQPKSKAFTLWTNQTQRS